MRCIRFSSRKRLAGHKGYGAPDGEAAPAPAATRRADRRPARRGGDPPLREALLAVARARALAGRARAALVGSLVRSGDDPRLGVDAAPHRVVPRRGRADRAARAQGCRVRFRRRALGLPARAGASPLLSPAGGRVARALRARGSRRGARAPLRARRAHAGTTPRDGRLRPRVRLALHARHRRRPERRRPLHAPARAGVDDAADCELPRDARRVTARLPRRRAPLLRPGRARRRLAVPDEEEERCRPTSCCRR
jgi:hypothetical protein